VIVAEFPAVLALGSNLGDRESTLRAAVGDIAAIPGVVLLRASGLVETPALKPDGVDPDAPAYLNAVVAVRSALGPHELLHALAGIEAAHGRVRDVRWGDRTLDIDIVTFAGQQLETDDLTLPHPRAASRVFVLAPWLQIDPSAMLPGIGPIAPLLAELLAASGETVSPYPAEPLT
jgi:2-amino-4-hydroxy-6-hydroxymethyldihydropteridine diphosphokinase